MACLCILYAASATLFPLIVIIYIYFRYKFQFWQKRNFPVPVVPCFPFGNFTGVKRSLTMDKVVANLYHSAPNEKIIGAYLLTKPILVVRDLELVKNILVKEFSSFHDRGFEVENVKEPLGSHLFILNGQKWRNIRIKLTPTFTSGKMKMMYPTMMDVGVKLVQVLEKCCDVEETEVKDILARYTTDVISSVAFGIETNSLNNPDAEFRKMGLELANPSLRQMTMILIIFAFPKAIKYIPVSFIPKHISDFFVRIVRETIEYRIEHNIHRNDFMQLLLQLKTLGYVKDADSQEKDENPEERQKFTLEVAASQAYLFFFAGFETSSATMQFALYELALNPELQKSVQNEIDKVLAENDNEIPYDALMQMELLDRIVSETLRKYPVAATLLRSCSKEYSIPGTELTILPGDNLWFPVYGFHHDPQYYPDPEKFNPDRFLPEVKESRPHFAYLPFGEGPRNCIGNRFGLMQTKAGLALLLAKFNLSPSKGTPIPLVLDPASNILAPKGKLHLKISKRD